MMEPGPLVVVDRAELAALAAAWISERARHAITARGAFSIALAGGTTPRPIYEALAALPRARAIDWARWHVFFGDERCVPADSPDSNHRMAREALLGRVPIPAEQVHRIAGEDDPEAAARASEAVLPAALDVVVLGVGPDGHVASLFPGSPLLEERTRRFAVVRDAPKPPALRITVTPLVLAAARARLVVAAGAEKADVIARARRGDDSLPAALARPCTWMVDRAAAQGCDAPLVLRGRVNPPPRRLAPRRENNSGGTMSETPFGIVGLAVMGRNLALNIEEHGFPVVAWNLEPAMTEAFLAEHPGKRLRGVATLAELVAALPRPRRILAMIKAGAPVDSLLAELAPLLEPGDTVIDGGNSFFLDTRRREEVWRSRGLCFMGSGVSGGEEGARRGPSLMPGGDRAAYEGVRSVLEAIAARTESGPCVTYCGPDGAGHFVKMVHNGIEYGDMQLIAEAYDVLARVGGLAPAELAGVFDRWNQGPLGSFLVEITARIFGVKDAETGRALVEVVEDRAGQKGTGKWTVQVALDLGVAIPTIAAAIDARVLSSLKPERVAAASRLRGPVVAPGGDRGALEGAVEGALLGAKICSYAQGMALIRAASDHYRWGIELGEMARIWKGGCIIRARLLDTIRAAFGRDPALANLLLDPDIAARIEGAQDGWRRVVALAAASGIPVPAFGASLAYYDAYRTARLPQNLTQAQRDAFGAHTYERTDRPGAVHTEWLSGEAR